ncbi:MAG: Ig-like domain-containing protein [Limisphaerales bacterium]
MKRPTLPRTEWARLFRGCPNTTAGRAPATSLSATLRGLAAGFSALTAALTTAAAATPNLAVTPHVVASGGGSTSGARFAVVGTLGQPIASNDLHPDDLIDFRAGFWAVVLRWKNSAPSATADLVSRRPGEAAHILIRQLLRNDLDPDYDALALSGFDGASALGGTVYRDGPWLIYQPPAGGLPGNTDSFSYRITDGDAPPVAGTVTVGPFIAPTDGPPNALAIVLDPGPPPVVRLRFQGIARRNYVVQAAPDPAGPWSVLGSVTAADNGRIDFADTPAPDVAAPGTSFP